MTSFLKYKVKQTNERTEYFLEVARKQDEEGSDRR